MEHHGDIKRSLLTFLPLTFLLSSIFYYLISTRGGMGAGSGLYVVGLMWCPGIAAIITRLLYRRNLRGMGWGWGKTRYQLLSYALPLLYTTLSYILIWATGLGGFYNRALAAHLNNQLRGAGVVVDSYAMVFVLYFSVVLTIGLLMGAVLSLGEEIGWRGLFVPEVARLTSYTRTALLTGIVWAVWHYPLILFANYNNRTPAWFGLTCFTVMIVGINFALVWLRLKSGSLWTGVIFHASHNLFIQSVYTPLTVRRPHTKYFIDEFGVVLAVASLIVAIYFWRRRDELQEAMQPATSATATATPAETQRDDPAASSPGVAAASD